MRTNLQKLTGAIIACLIFISPLTRSDSGNPVIPTPSYRPPVTVQTVDIPVDPTEQRIKVLIVSGENSYEHDWTGVNNLLRSQMQNTGVFDVRVVEDFSTADANMLAQYDVLFINYLGRWNYTDVDEKRWGKLAEKALFDYVKNGGGIVVYHASLNMGAPSWPEWERLVGGVMRPEHGSRRSPPNAFKVHVVDQDHAVTSGMREYMWTLNDDMYTNMKWHPEADVRVLVTAYDDAQEYQAQFAGPKYSGEYYAPENIGKMNGMNEEHPQVWTVEYGKGRVYCISLGHGPDTLQYDGVQSLILRGTQWAATGRADIEILDKARAFEVTP